jgi:hypothetical protein
VTSDAVWQDEIRASIRSVEILSQHDVPRFIILQNILLRFRTGKRTWTMHFTEWHADCLAIRHNNRIGFFGFKIQATAFHAMTVADAMIGSERVTQ